MAETGKSFWQTAPGVITAVATLITALGGVLAILVQNDIIGGSSDRGSLVVASSPAAGAGASQEGAGVTSQEASGVTSADPLEASSLIPWDIATATLARQDGTSAIVKAPTVGLACTSGTLEFKNGQRVSLERVRSIEFDAIYVENASADGVVTMLDERELTDPIHTWNCPVTGTNELGSLNIPLEDIERIDFHR